MFHRKMLCSTQQKWCYLAVSIGWCSWGLLRSTLLVLGVCISIAKHVVLFSLFARIAGGYCYRGGQLL